MGAPKFKSHQLPGPILKDPNSSKKEEAESSPNGVSKAPIIIHEPVKARTKRTTKKKLIRSFLSPIGLLTPKNSGQVFSIDPQSFLSVSPPPFDQSHIESFRSDPDKSPKEDLELDSKPVTKENSSNLIDSPVQQSAEDLPTTENHRAFSHSRNSYVIPEMPLEDQTLTRILTQENPPPFKKEIVLEPISLENAVHVMKKIQNPIEVRTLIHRFCAGLFDRFGVFRFDRITLIGTFGYGNTWIQNQIPTFKLDLRLPSMFRSVITTGKIYQGTSGNAEGDHLFYKNTSFERPDYCVIFPIKRRGRTKLLVIGALTEENVSQFNIEAAKNFANYIDMLELGLPEEDPNNSEKKSPEETAEPIKEDEAHTGISINHIPLSDVKTQANLTQSRIPSPLSDSETEISEDD